MFLLRVLDVDPESNTFGEICSMQIPQKAVKYATAQSTMEKHKCIYISCVRV